MLREGEAFTESKDLLPPARHRRCKVFSPRSTRAIRENASHRPCTANGAEILRLRSSCAFAHEPLRSG